MRVRCLSGAIRLELDTRPSVNSCRPSVDCLFQSAAEAMGPVLGVLLTGMGHDGLTGCRSVRTAGGRVLVQDAATSVIWGMPGAVATEGLADGILPLDRIAATIVETLGVRPLDPSRSLVGGQG
jgi:two-component system chemotaxis response regulator CheB